MKKEIRSELAFAGSLLLISLVVLWDTNRAGDPAIGVSVSPKLFPYFVGTFLLLLSVALIIQILRGKIATPEGEQEGAEIKRSDFKAFAMVLGSIISFVILIQRAGFVISSTITFFGITLAFGIANKLKALAIAAVFSIIVYEGFTRFLNVDLPAGWLTFL
jgi:putative tricarboxylic transport membrane protein